MNATADASSIDHLAHRRVRRKMGWYIHALAYVCVNLVLLLMSFSSGRHWALFPLFGWGIGLMVHGLVVFAAAPGGALYARLLAHERAALAPQQAGDRG